MNKKMKKKTNFNFKIEGKFFEKFLLRSLKKFEKQQINIDQ